MENSYNIDRILAECSTHEKISERDRWPVALTQWCNLYGLRTADLAEHLGVSRRTVESWRDASKPDPARFLIYALRYYECLFERRTWNKEFFLNSLDDENNA